MVTLSEEAFGTYKNDAVRKFTWTTKTGFSLSAISYGAIIQSIKVPGKDGLFSDVVLGFDTIEEYVEKNIPHFGSAIGRCANRIGGASFTIDGVVYQLAKNVGKSKTHHLHGGIEGFDKFVWKTTVDGTKVIFSYLSKDSEEGYPGDLVTNITYQVLDDDSFHVTFQSTTTKKTVVNLTNHSYFNLAGHETGAQELYKHVITINADRITETDSDSIPSGKFIKVGGTPYDLRVPISFNELMKKQPGLYDDNYCVSTYENEGINFVSRVEHPPSGRYLEVYSNQPGVQLYTSNFLPSPSDPALTGKGVGYRRHGAFCLETQNYPDAVHHPNFPSAVLVPGDIYKHVVIYRFGFEKGTEPVVVSA
ncbi:LOW QUALITY PROTEIN: galactose mutarotase [Aphomia sociella]